jgi:hypothetical protein
MPKTTEHPCNSHPCDHCYLCDGLGVCCASISPQQRAQLEADDPMQRERLRLAIVLEAGTIPSLGELVRRDAQRQRPAGSLPAQSSLVLPQAAAEPIPSDSRKEAAINAPTRPTR